ncbi:MAG: UDP-N-acetylglucosamine 2-epimerase (non-hydrolyzing) [Thermoproteota archaeon]|nr:MAG: UDP-N-acetylglucosamine 2-epimerase (non-hydrolyzing) [Candidatus Korarchaeota archaeon]
MVKILLFMGTRPEIIKMAPLIYGLAGKPEAEFVICDTSQHYDKELSKIFYEELKLPEPEFKLEIGSGSHGYQVSAVVKKAEEVITEYNPDLTVAEGDTNSVVGVALSSVKLKVPFAHVESGLRSYDMTMPEEVNRKIADSIASALFAPTERAALNLLYEGINPSNIWVTGNTIADTLQLYIHRAKIESTIIQDLELESADFLIVLTVHRPENTDNPKRLKSILEAVRELEECTILFPVHPRTKAKLEEYGMLKKLKSRKFKNLILLKPLGYVDFVRLLIEADAILTDSGGIQEEAAILGKPCITLRDNTERPETVELGFNMIAGASKDKIVDLTRKVIYDPSYIDSLSRIKHPFGDGHAGERIANIIIENFEDFKITAPKYHLSGAPTFRIYRVNEKLSGRTVYNLNPVIVTLIYHNGRPIIPTPDMTLEDGMLIRCLAEKPILEELEKKFNLA